MANNIPNRQNEESALRQLAASRRFYGWAKRALAAQLLFVIFIPGCLLVTEMFVPAFKVWAAFIGLLIAIVDIALVDWLKDHFQSKGASVQEVFDCDLFDLRPSALEADLPDREDFYAVPTGPRRNFLENWYPVEVGELPLFVARVACQRTNCWWDAKLRRFYRNGLLALGAITITLIAITALTLHLRFDDVVLALIAPMLPFILWAFRQSREQNEAAKRADRLKLFGDGLWRAVIARRIGPDEAATESRLFQSEIYQRRRRSPMIFDWFYWMFRNRFEEQMQHGAAALVREAKDRGF